MILSLISLLFTIIAAPALGQPPLQASADQIAIDASKISQTGPELRGAEARAAFDIGLDYYKQRKMGYAADAFEAVTRLEPDNPRGYFGLGICYVQTGKPILARQQEAELRRLNQALALELAKRIKAGVEPYKVSFQTAQPD